jgi:hypothetical protein
MLLLLRRDECLLIHRNFPLSLLLPHWKVVSPTNPTNRLLDR